MTYYSIPHWNPIEESRNFMTFEISLHSKMSKINFDHDFWDILIVKKYIGFYYLMKVTSVILIKDLIKQRIVASLCNFFFYEIETSKTDRFESDI